MTFGHDETGGPILKVWELRRHSRGDGYQFKSISSMNLHSEQPFPITCCIALEDLSHIAVGFSDGRVVLIKGDLARDRGAKQRTVYEGEEPITGLQFLVSSRSTVLYIFSTGKLLTLTTTNATGKFVTQIPRVMESVGAALGCVSKDQVKNEIVVIRQDAIYLYGVDGRGPCYALDGKKLALHAHKGYAIVTQPPTENKTEAVKVLGKIGIPDGIEDASRVTIFETTNKFVSYTGFFPQGLRSVFSEWDCIHLLTIDGRLFRLREIDMDAKLDILYAKSMYTLALNLAEEAGLEEIKVDKIHLKYGDYLYAKGDFESSVDQYILAIKQCEISTVMRKFLQAQHVPLLTKFLEKLHEAKLSNADYTTLLLNCYAKLKQKDKLQKFIRNEGDHPLDLEIAVALCRQAGYYDQAISLTSKHKNHVICLGIMLEDKKDHQAALTYIRKLKDAGDVGNLLNHFGRELMTHLSAETTRLFIDFYTGAFVPESDVHVAGIMSPPRRVTTGYGSAFYDSMVNNRYAQVLPSLPTLDMSQFNPMRRVPSVGPSIVSKEPSPPASAAASMMIPEESTSYAVPRPRTAFPIFVDFPQNFIQFLETVLDRQQPNEQDLGNKKDVVSTLLEIYLEQAKTSQGEAKLKWEQKAKSLLNREPNLIDSSDALLLFHLSSFEEGSILVQERAGRKEDVFRSYCTARDTKNVIKVLHQYGEDEPQLYTLALKYFTSGTKVVQEAGPELGAVLEKIHERKLLAPLQVIQALSTNAVATVGIVKSYLSDVIEKERKEIRANQSLIESYRAETEAKLKEAEDLATKARILQVSRCSRCNGTLELPVIHFLCKHSYHGRCITSSSSSSSDDIECPICQESNDAVKAVVKSKEELAQKQEFFKESLAATKDRANFLFSRLDLNMDQAISSI